MDIDSEKLIQNVEKFPCIWNDAIPEYQSIRTKDIAWSSVGACLVNNWTEIDLEEKSYRLEALKKRWGNIRDCYKKELYIQKNYGADRPLKKREPYIYTEKLEFLRPIYEARLENNVTKVQINNIHTNDMDSERLILAVKKLKCLWDSAAEDYQNKSVKDDAWNSVAAELTAEWNELNEDQKSFKLETLKKRWNNIKDSYKKELHTQKKCGPDDIRRKRQKYKHAKILGFLKPIYRQKDATVNIYTAEVVSSKLILVVKKYQCLWNVASDDYQYLYLKDIAWNSVGAHLIKNWALLNQAQKSVIIDEFKKRWNNIKDCYKKALNAEKYGSYRGKRKRNQQYKYIKKLEFLRPIYELKMYRNSLDEDEDIDSELLILSIEKFQCLWNVASAKFKNHQLKEIAWNSVAEDLINDWDELSEKQKSVKLKELKKRWNNIKDSFRREIYIQYKCGTRPPKKRKQYKYTEILDFMRPLFERKYIGDSLYTDDHNNSTQSEEYLIDNSQLSIPDHKSSMHSGEYLIDNSQLSIPDHKSSMHSGEYLIDNSQLSMADHSSSMRSGEYIIDNSQLSIPDHKSSMHSGEYLIDNSQLSMADHSSSMHSEEYLIDNSELSIPDHSSSIQSEEYIIDNSELSLPEAMSTSMIHEDDDADLMFLKSLLPDMRSLSDDQKFEFKMGVMQSLHKFRNERSSGVTSPHTNEHKCVSDGRYGEPDSLGDILEYKN